MPSVPDNAFLDKAAPPTPARVAEVLGARAPHFDALTAMIPAPRVATWKHYGKTAGWTLKLGAGARNLCFVVVRPRCFTVAFVMGDRAVAAAQASALDDGLKRELANARRYVEGRGIRVLVTSRQSLRQVALLLELKRQH